MIYALDAAQTQCLHLFAQYTIYNHNYLFLWIKQYHKAIQNRGDVLNGEA